MEMKFTDLLYTELNEARASMDYTTSDDKKPGDLLQSLYNTFDTNEWKPREDVKIRKSTSKEGDKLRYMLVSLKMIERLNNGKGNFKISQLGLKWITDNKDDEDSSIAKGVKDISTLKAKKFIVPKVSNNSKYLDQLKTILSHMKTFSKKPKKTTFMLGGDPGTGKTSFVKSLSTLTGLPLVVIEAPHITQEHLINIPFLVIDGDKTEKGNLQVKDTGTKMKVVQAESNLVTRLKQNRKRPQDKVIKDINKNKVLREVYPVLQNRLTKIRDSFNSILFLDEFYRTSSVKIRNVLRNILNGKIGNDKVPKGVYIIMATNTNDEGLDDVPLNQDFQLMDYDTSSKEDFMSYMYAKYLDDEDVDTNNEDETEEAAPNIKMDIWNKFMTELTDKDLGFNDEDADVRLSPRRLEQIIISLNALIPPGNEKEALEIIAFIRNNLTNYLERTSSEYLLEKFNKITTDLISESNPDINIDKLLNIPIKDSEWRDQLKTELKLKISLGDDRKYIPVLSGPPGIGKTSEMSSLANEMDMGFIQIDVSNLSPEDISGMPIADMSQGDDNITTTFSEPNLYITIMKDYNAQIEEFRQEGREYNIIVLFDELTRASLPVFNSIRKVLLEKEFEGIKLPSDILITGAINPVDTGAIEFTSHTRDVLDIIPSSGNFKNTMDYIKNSEELKPISESLGFDIAKSVASIMESLALEFQDFEDTDGNPISDMNVRPFYWSDGASKFYVSGREMTESVINTVNQIEDNLDDMDFDKDTTYTDKEYEDIIDEMINTTAKQFGYTFNMVTLKQDVQDFTNLLITKISKNKKYRGFFETIRITGSVNSMNLQQTLQAANNDINIFEKKVIGDYINDFESTEFSQEIGIITDDYLANNDLSAALIKIIDLFSLISKNLNKLPESKSYKNPLNNYKDQLNKHIYPKISAILENNEINIFDLMENKEIMKKIEKLNKLFNAE